MNHRKKKHPMTWEDVEANELWRQKLVSLGYPDQAASEALEAFHDFCMDNPTLLDDMEDPVKAVNGLVWAWAAAYLAGAVDSNSRDCESN